MRLGDGEPIGRPAHERDRRRRVGIAPAANDAITYIVPVARPIFDGRPRNLGATGVRLKGDATVGERPANSFYHCARCVLPEYPSTERVLEHQILEVEGAATA